MKIKTRPKHTLRFIPRETWTVPGPPSVIEVWKSARFLVQVYQEKGGVERITVNRVERDANGWVGVISWEELQDIKQQIGRGDRYAVEVYPRDCNVINVHNMRHLWVLPEPLDIGWQRSKRPSEEPNT